MRVGCSGARSVALVVMVMMLAGCAMASERPLAETTGSPTPTPTPGPSAITPQLSFPSGCDQLLSEAALSEAMGSAQRLAPEQPSADLLPGPLARDVAADAEQALACLWWPEEAMDGAVPLFAFRIGDEAQRSLIEGLRAAPEYVERPIDGAMMFETEFSDELFINQVRYVFADGLWIALVAPVSSDVADSLVTTALAALRS